MNNCIIVNVPDQETTKAIINNSFFDINGYCRDILWADESNFGVSDSHTLAIHKLAHHMCVAFVNVMRNVILGWYADATVYRDAQYDPLFDCTYHAICKTKHAYLLKTPYALPYPIQLVADKEAWTASKSEATNITLLTEHLVQTVCSQNISMNLQEQNANSELVCKNISNLVTQYVQEKNVSLLPKIYWSAKKRTLELPTDAEAWEYLGYALLELGRPQEALSCFERVLQLDPMQALAACDKGECLRRLDREREAIDWLNFALTQNSNDDIRLQLALTYRYAGYLSTAYRLLKEIHDAELKEFVDQELQDLEIAMPFLVKPKPQQYVLDTYPISLAFEKEPLPQIHTNARGVSCYWDIVRKKDVIITPEETVRQQVISYLLRQTKCPQDYILVEESLAHIDRSMRDRVDILVQAKHRRETTQILLVECKAPNIVLDGEPLMQLQRYNTVLHAPFVLLTNGNDSYLYHYDSKSDSYQTLRTLPTYEDMCTSENIVYANLPTLRWSRPVYQDLTKQELYQQYSEEGCIGVDTPKNLRPIILNLAFCLLDESHRVSCPLAVNGCTIEYDYGVIPKTTGNAGGGIFAGNYRQFGVLDRNGVRHNVYLAVLGIMKTKDDPHWGTRSGTTTLYFAIEENGSLVSKLQLCLDRCLIPDNCGYRLTHTGVRSRRKIQPLLDYVAAHVPDLLSKTERICCGWLSNEKNLYLSDTTVAQTIAQSISYLLLRSELHNLEQSSS